jgi:uncharacterized LabA/DUF88 family protein
VSYDAIVNSPPERRIALFIDFENLVTNTGITVPNFNLQPAMDRLLEKGKVIFRRAYCDWSRFREAKRHLHEFGVELVDVPPSTRAGKNSADMRLVIDALELCYAREHINTFVIASGDSDFCPLAYKLRENDRLVIGLAVKEATSPFFVKACDEFIYLRGQSRGDDRADARAEARGDVRGDSRPPARPKLDAKSDAKSDAKPDVKSAAAGDAASAKRPRAVPAIARQVVSNLLARATGPLNPSFIKETIVRKEPDFDERDHGFATFSRLLEAMEKEGLLKRQQQGRQLYVVSFDSAPVDKGGDAEGDEDGDDAEPDEEEFPF